LFPSGFGWRSNQQLYHAAAGGKWVEWTMAEEDGTVARAGTYIPTSGETLEVHGERGSEFVETHLSDKKRREGGAPGWLTVVVEISEDESK